jgi:hypothetical protein
MTNRHIYQTNYYSITCEIFRIYILKYFEIFFIIATHNIFQSQRFWLIIHYSGQSKNWPKWIKSRF